MATSGEHLVTIEHGRHVKFTWVQSYKDPVNNTSQIYWSIKIVTTDGKDFDYTCNYDIRINSDYFYEGTKNYSGYDIDVEVGENTEKTFDNGVFTIFHNGNDASTFIAEFTVTVEDIKIFWTDETVRGRAEATVDAFNIERRATISAINSFTDEDNPTIYFYNPAKNSATLSVAISLDGGTTYNIPFDPIEDPTASFYSMSLNDSARRSLRMANTTGNEHTATFILRSVVGGWTYEEKKDVTYTIINVDPTLSPTVKDVDSYTKSLTGNDQKFILGYSNAQFNTGADPKKQATIDYQNIRCGSVFLEDYSSNTGTIENINSNTFYFEMKNSRGLTVNSFKVLDVVPYTKLTTRVETGPFTANGRVTFTIKGLYFNGSFGAQNNSMQVQYSLRDTDGNFAQVTGVRESGWVELGAVHPTTGSGTYEFSHTITGLDYTKTWELTVAVQDALTPLQTVTTVVAPLPTFDWSDEDFHHHTDVVLSQGAKLYLGDVEIGSDNKVLWADGGWHMRARETIYLNEPISKQKNGIVLVFSLFRNNTMEDASFNSFFVSKKEVEILPGKPHTFLMGINAGFSKIGAKYIYISDDSMTGDDTNVSSGTNNGITFDNNSFVLRYVIGV